MTFANEPPLMRDGDDDDSSWREDMLALRRLVTTLALRLAMRAENPFEELATIRRLALDGAADTARIMSPRRDAEDVEREIDAMITLAERQII